MCCCGSVEDMQEFVAEEIGGSEAKSMQVLLRT